MVYELTIRPASLTPNVPIPDDAPVIDIPDGAITLDDLAEESYKDGMAIGLQQTGSCKITVHHALLSGTSDLEDLRDYLMHYDVSGGGSLTVNGETRTFPTSNLFILKSDNGAKIHFEGTQRANPGSDTEIEIGVGVTMKYELYSLFRSTTETVLMEWVCQVLLGLGYDADEPWQKDHANAYDWLYEKSGRKYFWRHTGYKMAFWKISTVFKTIQQLCNSVHCQLYRIPITSGGTNWKFAFRSHREDPDDWWATPWDHWRFHKQPLTDTPDPDNPGATLGRDEFGIMGRIKKVDNDDVIAGLFLPGSDSIYEFGNVYDFLRQCCDAAICRGKITRVAGDTRRTELIFYRPYENYPNPNFNRFALDKLRFPHGQKRIIKARTGGKVLTGAKVQLRGAQGKDLGMVVYKPRGSSVDPSWTTRTIFDVNPTIGEVGWWYPGFADGFGAQLAVGAQTIRCYAWKFWYFDQVMGLEAPVPIRCDTYVEFDDGRGLGLYGVQVPYTLPTPNLPHGSTTNDQIKALIIYPMRKATAPLQKDTGIQGVLTTQYVQIFGKSDITAYPITVPIWYAHSEAIGEPMVLPLRAAGAPNDATGLLATGETYLDLPGWCVVVSAKPDFKNSRTQLMLQGLIR